MCGRKLDSEEQAEVPPAVIDLLEIVRTKALSLPQLNESSSGLPVRELGAMSLRSLLYLIRSLGSRVARDSRGKEAETSNEDAVKCAAELLSDWPRNFRRMLAAKLGPPSLANPCSFATGRLSGLYGSLIYGFEPKQDAALIRSEMVKSAIERFGVGTRDVNERKKVCGSSPKYVTRPELAMRLGIERYDVDQMLADGNVSAVRVKRGNTGCAVLYDLTTVRCRSPFQEKRYSATDAAAVIGIQRQTLLLLREQGVFPRREVLRGKQGFFEQDVKEFREKLLRRASVSSKKSLKGNNISLDKLFARPTVSAMAKAIVISEVISGRLPVAGMSSKSLSDILLPEEAVISLLKVRCGPDWASLRERSSNVVNGSGGISTRQAAREIGCHPSTISGLIKRGLLRRVDGQGNTIWICQKSVDKFRKRFEPLGSVARTARTTTRLLIKICDELKINLVRVQSSLVPLGAFIRRIHLPNLLSKRWYAKVVDYQTRHKWRRLVEVGVMEGPNLEELPNVGGCIN